MAINLVSLITQFITPDIVARIAEALGIDRSKAQTAITAAVPGILSGLAGSAATQPGGAQRIAAAVNQSGGVFDSMTSVIGGGHQSALMGAGSQLMSALFGSRDSNALSDAVGRYSGVSQTQSSALLSMLTPLVMGGIGQAAGQGQLNAGGVTNLLVSQEDNITSALPASFKHMLSGTGQFNVFSDATRTARAAGARVGTMAGDGMRAAASTAHRFGTSAQGAGDRALSWFDSRLYWLVPLVALTALAIWIFSSAPRDNINRASVVPTIMIGGNNIAAQVASNVADMNRALADLDNPKAAPTVVPRLRVINEHLGKVTNRLNELTPGQRGALAKLVEPSLPAVDRAMADAVITPDVPDDLHPTLQELRSNLDAFSS